jgi:hypothetical protein
LDLQEELDLPVLSRSSIVYTENLVLIQSQESKGLENKAKECEKKHTTESMRRPDMNPKDKPSLTTIVSIVVLLILPVLISMIWYPS